MNSKLNQIDKSVLHMAKNTCNFELSERKSTCFKVRFRQKGGLLSITG